MNPKLSIITPCYNGSKTLEEAIESTFNQGFSSEEFEIILVDDASTDNSYEVMSALATRHKNIKILKQPENKGGGAARNHGIGEARAPVIFVLDSDDILLPHTLSHMLDYLHAKKADVVAFNYSTKFRGTNTKDIVDRLELPYRDQKIPIESLLIVKKAHSPVVINGMFLKSAWEKAGGYPEHHHFDTQGFGWRLLAAGLTAYTCPDAEYMHRVEYHESYYLREWNKGKSNLNWREILMENEPLFTDEVKQFLKTYPYQNFTKDIIMELQNFSPVFRPDYAELLGKIVPRTERIGHDAPIPRNSIRGVLYRLQYRIGLFLNRIK